MAKTTVDTWKPDFPHLSDIYKPILPAYEAITPQKAHWPGLNEYQALINQHAPPIVNQQNKEITFVQQSKSCPSYESQYEPRIYLEGEVQTRMENWHDFFQVLVWKTFPKTKLLLNDLHYQESSRRLRKDHSNKQRTSVENFITLFDECGIVIVSHDKELLNMIENFQWKEIFVENRRAFSTHLDCITFGHAMYEKALSPYIGMTANAILIHQEPAYFELSKEMKLKKIDELIYTEISEEIPTDLKKRLTPFPLLGVPNWHKENNDPAFYSNENYFRKKRVKK